MRTPADPHKRCAGRILLAEDDEIVRMVTTKVLKQAAYSVMVVANGLEAIEALKSADFDIVLMDGSMPVMDGFEATRIIRENGSGICQAGIPIIALTALTTREDKENCLKAGMNDHVSKPINPGVLISAIERCLAKHGTDTAPRGQLIPPDKPVWDDKFLDTIIDKFLDEVPQVITDLSEAVDRGDIGALELISHRLRGSADLLGASGLSSLASTLEQAAKNGDTKDANQYAADLIGELQLMASTLSEE